MNCKLCENPFDAKKHIPKNLQCGHSFCEQCLIKNQIYIMNDNNEKELMTTCPKCFLKTYKKLPVSYAILDIIDTNDHDSLKNKNQCNVSIIYIYSFRFIQKRSINFSA